MGKYVTLIFALVVIVPFAASADTASLPPTDDAYVWGWYPDLNYGYFLSLNVGFSGGWFNTLIKFDISDYIGATINNAYIRFYVYDHWGAFPTDEVKIVRNDRYWNEGTVTWRNKPLFDGTPVNLTAPGAYGWWEVYVTDFIQDFVDGTYVNYGFQIYKNDTDVDGFYMYSKENSTNRPSLEIDYTPTAVESASLGRVKAVFK